MSYPIHITNIYELLNEDGEPTSVKVNTPSSANSKDTKQTAQRTTTNVGANQQKTTGQTSTKGASKTGNQFSRGSGERGPLGERRNTDRQSNDRVGRPQGERPPRQQGDRPPRQQNFSTQGSEDVESRNRGASGFGGAERRDTGESRGGERRARGAPAGGFVGNRRVFDRKSGTGRGRDQKKGGSGRGNWGKEGDVSEQVIAEDVAAVEEGKEDVKEDKPEEPEKEKVETEEEKQEREEREQEEKTMTLQDYLKQRSKAPVVALPTERKANEGVDQNEAKKWNNYQEIKREEDQETDASTGAKDKKKKEKALVQTFFTVKDTTQPRRDRDDSRGGDRRGGDRRGGRGGSSTGSRGGDRRGGSRGGRGGSRGGDAPHFDESSFPKL